MKKLVIIGANDFQNQLIIKAKQLGYETHVFAWEEGAVGKDNADCFYPLSITEKEKILSVCQEIRPDGVCSIASDLAVPTVNYVASALALPGNKPEFSAMQTNKYEMRRALKKAGIPCPQFIKTGADINAAALRQFRFPVIVKPTDRSGSRAITKLNAMDGLEAAIRKACEVSFEKQAIVEEFIEGEEFSLEAITQNGVHHFLAVTRKFTTGAPHFIETGHIQPSGLDETAVQRVKEVVFRALDALHIENSASHSEFRIDSNGGIHIIEIGARMGGDCIGSDLVYLSTGNDFMKMVIDTACGNPITMCGNAAQSRAEIRFLFTQQDVDELRRLQAAGCGEIYRISDIDEGKLGAAQDSSTRAGYYILTDRKCV